MHLLIDTTFDFRTDTPPGKDPDTFSPPLRKYHHFVLDVWNIHVDTKRFRIKSEIVTQ